MARKARLRSDNRIYHIILRGIDGQDIFLDDEDKIKMMQILKDKKQDNAFFLYSFCIMHNHIHLIIREVNDNISHILKRAATSFAFYFNKKYSKTGRVFQDRFKSEALSNEHDLFEAIKFVHKNPQKAGIEEMDKYRWSSYPEYTGKSEVFTDYTQVLDMISKDDRGTAIKKFISLSHEDNTKEFFDITEDKEIDKGNVYDYINEYLMGSKISLGDLKKPENKKIRDIVILYLVERSNLSGRSIAEILGINRETVRKAVLTKEVL